MSPVRDQLNHMIDYLPEAEQALLLEIVRRFVSDDVATVSYTHLDVYKRQDCPPQGSGSCSALESRG